MSSESEVVVDGENVDEGGALNADIVENGVVFKKNPVKHEPHKRMTKQEIHDFVRWAFAQNDENMSKYSNAKIANMYMNDTGRCVCRETVRRNRDGWFMKDGKIYKK
jgi:hypothetical protein